MKFNKFLDHCLLPPDRQIAGISAFFAYRPHKNTDWGLVGLIFSGFSALLLGNCRKIFSKNTRKCHKCHNWNSPVIGLGGVIRHVKKMSNCQKDLKFEKTKQNPAGLGMRFTKKLNTMGFIHSNINFDVTYENHLNHPKTYFMNILRIFFYWTYSLICEGRKILTPKEWKKIKNFIRTKHLKIKSCLTHSFDSLSELTSLSFEVDSPEAELTNKNSKKPIPHFQNLFLNLMIHFWKIFLTKIWKYFMQQVNKYMGGVHNDFAYF